MMGIRFLASMVLFSMASADKTDAEPAHVNAPHSLCLLQTQAVRGVVDEVHSYEEGVASDPDVKVDEGLFEEDDGYAVEKQPDQIAELQVELDAYAPGTQSAGHCTLADEAEMKKLGGGSGKGSFPKVLAECGRKAYRWFRWKRDRMEKCVRERAKISAPCTKCFSAAGQYGYDKCKSQCLFGDWCSERCLGCTGKHDAHTEKCVGADVDVPKPDFC